MTKVVALQHCTLKTQQSHRFLFVTFFVISVTNSAVDPDPDPPMTPLSDPDPDPFRSPPRNHPNLVDPDSTKTNQNSRKKELTYVKLKYFFDETHE